MLEKIFPYTAQRVEAVQAFWAVYMLERRLSLGLGIPFSIQDSYIDRSIYTIDLANPLLTSLLQWTRLAGKTWHALNNQIEKTYESRVDEINYLDYEITHWFDKLPEEYRLRDTASWTLHPPLYYHSVFFVRKTHLQNLIYRPILQLPVTAGQHEPTLLKAIEISRDTVRTLYRLNEQTPLIRTHPMFFQQLLLTAFGNLLLAVVGTGPKIRNSTRTEFDMFLQLFQLLSSECAALRRTWQRLQGLRDLHTRLGHSDRSTHTPHRNASDAPFHATNSLSFDDIFPDVDLSSTLQSTTDSSDYTGVEAETQNPICVLEGFVDLEDLFDFPFLDIPS
ncbi:hypothetical protein N0V91_007831 [Didymella pomorum]|uniref:Transcription factor domain-containing protein n=1 Tax=Didymella pomorum TaxID=749634 RepID=A0A9W8ZA02_9PLEO|nr:hypothetical protein N0V91_007831 [Didymella pomorum]